MIERMKILDDTVKRSQRIVNGNADVLKLALTDAAVSHVAGQAVRKAMSRDPY